MPLSRLITNPIEGEASEYVGKHSGSLVILGGGWNVWEDYQSYSLRENGHVMAVNDIGMHFPHELHHWYSNHADFLWGWGTVRSFHHPGGYKLHSNNEANRVLHWNGLPGTGTSAINAIYVALLMGYEEIMLCGIPLDNKGHYFDPRPTNFEREGKERVWLWARNNVFDGRVKSMSGRTKEWLCP